jgi:TPR repeat protein
MACDGGLATACGGLGISYAFGQGVAKDTRAAVPLLRRSCDGGAAPACSALATLLRTGDGAPRDANGALQLLQRGCVAQDIGSCHALAEMYAAGEGGPRNPTLATQTYRQSLQAMQGACRDGVAAVCAQIGWYHDNGLGTAVNRNEAIRFYRQALQHDRTNELASARLREFGVAP